MLALTRGVGEEIVIGDPKNPIGVIKVVEMYGNPRNRVRLSFDFPKEISVNRREVADQIAAGVKKTTAPESKATATEPGPRFNPVG